MHTSRRIPMLSTESCVSMKNVSGSSVSAVSKYPKPSHGLSSRSVDPCSGFEHQRLLSMEMVPKRLHGIQMLPPKSCASKKDVIKASPSSFRVQRYTLPSSSSSTSVAPFQGFRSRSFSSVDLFQPSGGQSCSRMQMRQKRALPRSAPARISSNVKSRRRARTVVRKSTKGSLRNFFELEAAASDASADEVSDLEEEDLEDLIDDSEDSTFVPFRIAVHSSLCNTGLVYKKRKKST